MEKLNDDDLTGDALHTEVTRSDAFFKLASVAVKNAALIVSCTGLYDVPLNDLPLLPVTHAGIKTAKTVKLDAEKIKSIVDKRYLLKSKGESSLDEDDFDEDDEDDFDEDDEDDFDEK
jgi:hypothetical protein